MLTAAWRRASRSWRALLNRSRADAELERELQLHIDLEAAHLVRTRGLSAEAARRQALIAFGGVERHMEALRDRRAFEWVDALLRETRQGVRALMRRRGVTGAAVLTLGVGIGATTAVFSAVHGILYRPLPYPGADRLVALCEDAPDIPAGFCVASPPTATAIAAESAPSFEALGVAREWSYHLLTHDGSTAVAAGIANEELFAALGVRAEAGELFTSPEKPGQARRAVLTHELWLDVFGGSRDLVGREITLDGEPVTVVGILPPGVRVPGVPHARLWRPLPFDPASDSGRVWGKFSAIGRLRPGVSLEALRGEVASRAPVTVIPLLDVLVRHVRPALALFGAGVLVLLLIACANVANLLLAVGTLRRRELALRLALGARPTRLVRTLLLEALLIALAAASLGFLLAWCGTAAFRALAPSTIPRLGEVRVTGVVLLFTIGVAFLATLLFGLLPALRSTRLAPFIALRDAGPTSTPRGSRVSRALVVLQLSLAMVLLTMAGGLLRRYLAMSAWAPGFHHENVLIFTVSAPSATYGSGAAMSTLWEDVEKGLRGRPGILEVGTASAGPLFGSIETTLVRAEGGRHQSESAGSVPARYHDISAGLPRALGLTLVAGRLFDARDTVGAAPVALVNESLERRLWRGGSAVGRRVTSAALQRPLTIVGVLRNVPPLGAGPESDPAIYTSSRQFPRQVTNVVVRTAGPPTAQLQPIRRHLAAIDPDLSVGNVTTYRTVIAGQLAGPRFDMLLVTVIGAAALMVAAMGTLSLVTYVVARRRREFAVRVALGADRRTILLHVLRPAAVLAGLGGAAGMLGAVASHRLLAHWIEDVARPDALTLTLSAAVLACVALGASAIPAMRAARTDLMAALRTE